MNLFHNALTALDFKVISSEEVFTDYKGELKSSEGASVELLIRASNNRNEIRVVCAKFAPAQAAFSCPDDYFQRGIFQNEILETYGILVNLYRKIRDEHDRLNGIVPVSQLIDDFAISRLKKNLKIDDLSVI